MFLENIFNIFFFSAKHKFSRPENTVLTGGTWWRAEDYKQAANEMTAPYVTAIFVQSKRSRRLVGEKKNVCGSKLMAVNREV